jgi:hypothetical protein
MAEKLPRKPAKPARKRRWQPPKIKSGQLFEANSLACGKSTAAPQDECFQGVGGGLQQS